MCRIFRQIPHIFPHILPQKVPHILRKFSAINQHPYPVYRLKIDFITVQYAILFETAAEHKSQQQSKLYNVHMYNMLKCIKYYENINLK